LRNLLLSVSLFLVSFYWLAALPFTQPSGVGAAVLLAAGSIAFLASREGREEKPPGLSAWLAVPILGLALVVLPYPYSAGAAVMLAGSVLSLLARRNPRVGGLSSPLVTLGSILLVQAILAAGLIHVFARYHETRLMSAPLYLLVKLVHPAAARSAGSVFIPSEEELFRIITTWEGLGIQLLVLYFGSLAVIMAAREKPLEKMVKLAVLFFVYALLRYTLLALLLVRFKDPGIYWAHGAVFWTFLPLPLATFFLLRGSRVAGRASPVPAGAGRLPLAAVLLAAGAFALVGSYAFQDPGVKKQGRVMIDEYHSQWEWTTKPFDTEWYGKDSGYNYYCLAQYLDKYYEVDIRETPFTEADLKGYDVLIIKTPTRKYTDRELDAIEQFVRRGGGLFLIGDHTNVFGISTYLNPVASRFGIAFRFDSQYDIDTGGLTFYRKPRVMPHPVLAALPYFLFATSCTLEAGLTAENVMIGSGQKALEVDYSQVSYFPEKLRNPYPFGYFVQLAGKKAGRGRVLAFTDSTTFSNFFMFIPGKPELLLGSMEWLNRENRFRWLNWVLFLAGLALVAGGLRAALGQGARLSALAATWLLLGTCLGILLFDSLSRAAYGPPQPRKDFISICFDGEHSNILLPTHSLVPRLPEAYHTFFTWTQRLGYFPSLEPRVEDCLSEADVVVIVNPDRHFSVEEVDSLYAYVSRGGKLLVLDTPRNERSTVRDIAGPFGIAVYTDQPDSSVITDLQGRPLTRAFSAGWTSGGEPVLLTGAGKPVMCRKTVAKGEVRFFLDSSIFSDPSMGGTGVTPDRRQREVYALQFWMLRDLVEPAGETPARLSEVGEVEQ